MNKLTCRLRTTSLLACTALLGAMGCGTPGAPQPPSLHLPGQVEDLRATRKGDKVLLTWTVPVNTTDEQAIGSRLGITRVCRNYSSGGCHDVVADIPPGKLTAGKPAEQQDSIAAAVQANPGKEFVNYTVETLNRSGRGAGPSNSVTVFLAPGMPAVQELTAKLQHDAVVLSWTLPAISPNGPVHTKNMIRVTRSEAGNSGAPTVLAELPAQPGPATFADRSFQWEKNYNYRVLGISQVQTVDGKVLSTFEGDEAYPIALTTHDVFPPNAPVGLQAVYSSTVPGYIDLTWTPNPETDLAGYNVYRAAQSGIGGGEFVRINSEPVKTPAFRDAQVKPGTYQYRVSAVDARGNESPQSQATSETVPAQ